MFPSAEVYHDPWSLVGPMWIVRVDVAPSAPSSGALLQAEMRGGRYVLCFTTREKAETAIGGLSVDNAWPVRMAGQAIEVVSAVCHAGAVGIIVDFDPGTRKCAWSRQIVAAA